MADPALLIPSNAVANPFAQILLGVARHGLTVLAGTLIAQGYLTQAGGDSLVGAALALLVVGWSIAQKLLQHKNLVALAAQVVPEFKP